MTWRNWEGATEGAIAEIHQVAGVASDITKRKMTEEALRQSEMELRFLSSKLLTAQEEERRGLPESFMTVLDQSLLVAIKISLENARNEALEKLRHGKPGTG